jgi:thioredoxin reductase
VLTDVVVVGAGQCGLLAARSLASDWRVVLVERLPAAGGQEPEHPGTDELYDECVRRGVCALFGTLAVRYTGSAAQVLGVAGADEITCGALVVATGTRPSTRAEMGIGGDRAAGILPGPAALHLTDSGVLLGRRPVVLGRGQLAVRCADRLVEGGASAVTLVAAEPPTCAPAPGVRIVVGWRPRSIHGNPRVSSIDLQRDGNSVRLQSDAVILADGRIPMRNVEGAVGPAPGVVFCQSRADPKQFSDARRCAEAAARSARSMLMNNGTSLEET